MILHVLNKLVSLFEPATQIIRKGKSSKPTEFGKLIKIQEAILEQMDWLLNPHAFPK
jgi:hypothetical protein